MVYICKNVEIFDNKQHHGESTECVALVKKACGAPQTALWKKGKQVKGNSQIAKGTGIATFSGESYSGHAAIYLSQDSEGIQVLDQWNGHPASQRKIRFNGGSVSNDGNQFYVIE